MKKYHVWLLFVVLLTWGAPITARAQDERISVLVNGVAVVFNSGNPVNKNGAILVPARDVFETAGAFVQWLPQENTVLLTMDEVTVTLQIGEQAVKVAGTNGEHTVNSAWAPEIIDNKTYIPVRTAAECLNWAVEWEDQTKTVSIRFTDGALETENQGIQRPMQVNLDNIVFHTGSIAVKMGDTLQTLERKLGKPNRIDESIYEFDWYIYNGDYSQYAQIGVKDSKVVAFFSNSELFNLNGLKSKTTAQDLNILFDTELLQEEIQYFEWEDAYKLTIYRDKYKEYALDAVLLIDTAYSAQSIAYGAIVVQSMENEVMDIINAQRVKSGTKALQWDAGLSEAARVHSVQMAQTNDLGHTGTSLLERLENAGVQNISQATENIGKSHRSAIEAYAYWMGTINYRNNILDGTMTKAGVGIVKGTGSHGLYYTVDFYTSVD